MTGRVCGADGCGSAAVRQWLRRGTDEEAAGYQVVRLAGAERVAAYRKAQAVIALTQLEDTRLRVVDDPRTTPMVLAMLDGRIREAQADLDAAPAGLPEPAVAEPVVVAVFGCAEHAVDVDAATRVHEAACAAGACGC